MENKYVELLAQSNFSFLTGASHPEELMEESFRLELAGLAIADSNGVSGLVRGYERYKSLSEKLVEPFHYIVGSLVDLGRLGRLSLLAETREGYGKITEWISSWEQNLSSEKESLKDIADSFFNFWSKETSRGVICLPRAFDETYWGALAEVFRGHCYVPMIRYLDGRDRERHQEVLTKASFYSLPIVASNDVYYHRKERKNLQDVLLSIRENTPLAEMGFRLFPNAERHLKSPREMQLLFQDNLSFLDRTYEVAERCQFQLSELRYYYPSEWIPSGYSAQQYLTKIVWEGACERYQGAIPKNVEGQIKHELSLIAQLNFADYFLTIYDITEYARSRKILCQGRGSAANSVVCYVLGITAVDPVKMNLLFERFLSVERGEPPDIDVDFEHERREEVIQYVYQKYGRHRAAMVCTHVCFRRRSALREVAKAFGVSVGTVSARQLEREWENRVPDERQRNKIELICKELRGFPRHLSIHTGGFTLSADPITRIVPVVPARMVGRTVIQWNKNDLETLGLLKVDLLALGMLSALRKTLDRVGVRLYEIPDDDQETYRMIQRSDTVGTFQVESRAQMSMLGRLQPQNFYDMVVQVAIVRPGPIVGKMVHPYLRRRRGLEPIHYQHPKLEQILGRTLGIPLFQEQIMKLAIDIVGFTAGEADQLRRAIGAWRSSGPIDGIAERLIAGLRKQGLAEGWVQQISDQIRGFSEYGFPESHAASFALLAYASCYLKRHYPTEFLCALINSQPMGFYRVDSLIYDGLRHGVKVLPVHLKHSQWESVIEADGALRLGFSLVRGLGRADYQRLDLERQKAPFKNAKDFLLRTQLRESVLRRLTLCGRLGDPRSVLWALMAYSLEDTSDVRQPSLFEWGGESEIKNEEHKEVNHNWETLDSLESLAYDYEAFGYSRHGHPMMILRQRLRLPKLNSLGVRSLASGDKVEVAGMVLVRQKPPTAAGMVFATMEDEYGFIDLCLSPDIYAEFRELFLTSCFLLVYGKTQRDLHTVSVKVERIEALGLDTKSTPSLSSPYLEPTQYF